MSNNQEEGFIAVGHWEIAGYTIRKLAGRGKNANWVVEHGVKRYVARHTLRDARKWANENPYQREDDTDERDAG